MPVIFALLSGSAKRLIRIFRPIEVVLSRRRLPYITISRLFCHTQPPFLNKGVRFMGKVEQPGNEEVIV